VLFSPGADTEYTIPLGPRIIAAGCVKYYSAYVMPGLPHVAANPLTDSCGEI